MLWVGVRVRSMLRLRSNFDGSAAPQSLYRKEWFKVAAEEETRINGQIRARSVRLISESGEQLGIKHIKEAMEYAERRDLDLVEVAANSDPPVVRIMDYGKYKYQKEQARKAARKKQVNINVREIKLRPKIGDNDFNTKRGHVERFLRHGDKVKVTIMFRGREVQHPDLGEKLLRQARGRPPRARAHREPAEPRWAQHGYGPGPEEGHRPEGRGQERASGECRPQLT